MAGWLTDQMQLPAAITQNGTTTTVTAFINNGTAVSEGAAPVYTQVPYDARMPVDVVKSPQSIPLTAAATAWQVAAHAASLITNTGSSTAGAATLNTVAGLVTTEALTTAAGSTYTFTLTNSLITATSPVPQIELLSGTNTAGNVQINSITNGSGSVVAVFQNTGTAAWNGKMLFAFHV